MIEIDGVNVEEAAIVRPGDTLIVRVAPTATMERAMALKKRGQELLPDVNVVVVAAEEIAVVRPEPEES